MNDTIISIMISLSWGEGYVGIVTNWGAFVFTNSEALPFPLSSDKALIETPFFPPVVKRHSTHRIRNYSSNSEVLPNVA